MSKHTMHAVLAALAALSPAMASARVEYSAVEEKNIAKGKQSIDPAKGYLFMKFPDRANGMFFKTPTAEDVAAYEKEWREAFEEAKAKYPKQLASWERDADYAKETRRTFNRERPVEPTEESFSIGNFETRFTVSFGPQYVYAKGEEEYSYLVELEPGTYTYYGPVLAIPNGAVMGVCYCMGSVKFEVPAGQITNLGDFLAMRWYEPSERAVRSNPRLAGRTAQPLDYSLPESLASHVNARAELRAAGKMNNHYGILIDRIEPVPGVLAYDRDIVLDLKAEPETIEAPETAVDEAVAVS